MPELPLKALLRWCFIHFYGLDISNAAVHTAPVRFSPITFRLAQHLMWIGLDPDEDDDVFEVLNDLGKYEEDKGRA